MTLLIVDLWQYCVFCISSGTTRCTRLMVLNLDCMCQCWLRAVPWSHIGVLIRRLAAEPPRTAGLLFTSQCPSGTFLLTPYTMGWDWLVSRAGPLLFYRPKLSYPNCLLYYFSLSLISVYRLVLWGWGLRTDRVHITLPQLCTADFFK